MESSLASAITQAASRQTYYTIRLLVDRPLKADAYRAYAYFRWLDDILDAGALSGSDKDDSDRLERALFLDRQKSLMEACFRKRPPRDVNPHEAMLVELLRHTGPGDIGLESYVAHMMLVMDFDARRRGRLVSQPELDQYTRWLSIAVSEAMHHFIGNTLSPRDESRYLAVSGAHILHMLRDTYADMRAGYFNVPRELLAANSITPQDVTSEAYRAWVEERVRLASRYLEAGRAYFARVASQRHRMAGFAYIARFEWLIETLEREDYRLRPHYSEGKSLARGFKMSWQPMSLMLGSQTGSRAAWMLETEP